MEKQIIKIQVIETPIIAKELIHNFLISFIHPMIKVIMLISNSEKRTVLIPMTIVFKSVCIIYGEV
ncbi:MAG: hypothetical protein LIO93_07145, partial [Bacteroidales bacterium]|nr:hypothetical protein [Bacteroidales bacterium]